jgi:hypothetical protein
LKAIALTSDEILSSSLLLKGLRVKFISSSTHFCNFDDINSFCSEEI